MNRRNFMQSTAALFCAPAIVRADSLMKIWVPPESNIITIPKEGVLYISPGYYEICGGGFRRVSKVSDSFGLKDGRIKW